MAARSEFTETGFQLMHRFLSYLQAECETETADPDPDKILALLCNHDLLSFMTGPGAHLLSLKSLSGDQSADSLLRAFAGSGYEQIMEGNRPLWEKHQRRRKAASALSPGGADADPGEDPDLSARLRPVVTNLLSVSLELATNLEGAFREMGSSDGTMGDGCECVNCQLVRAARDYDHLADEITTDRQKTLWRQANEDVARILAFGRGADRTHEDASS